MPTYEYKCDKCGATFETEQKITDEPLRECREEGCDGEVRRQIGLTAFTLKGSGWYKDGY